MTQPHHLAGALPSKQPQIPAISDEVPERRHRAQKRTPAQQLRRHDPSPASDHVLSQRLHPICLAANAQSHIRFLELCARRRSSGFGPEPIAWDELAAWAALRGIRPTPYELEVLQALEAAWFRARNE